MIERWRPLALLIWAHAHGSLTSAAVPVAAVREKSIALASTGATVIVISGGNIDQEALDEILESRG